MFYSFGNPPIVSTQAEATNPTTAAILAEIAGLQGGLYEARIVCGASTLATMLIEQCLSTGLGSTALRSSGGNGELGQRTVYTPVMQSAQYMLRFKATDGDRIRVRTSALTGTASATIILESVT